MADVGRKALLGAGGFGYNGVVVVSQCLDLTGLGVVAVGAIPLLTSRLGAGGGEVFNPVAHGMTQSIDVAVGVGVAAMASIGRKALLGAGRRGHGGGMAMPEGGGGVGLGVVAVRALTLFRASSRTSGCLGLYPVAHGVTQSIDISVGVGVATMASIGRKALLCAGRSSHGGDMAMSEGGNGAGLGRAAARAGAALGAAYSAGRGGGLLPCAKLMLSFCGVGVLVAVAATGACVGGVALGGASGLGHFGGKVGAVSAVDAVFPDFEIEGCSVEAVIIIANVIDKEINTVQIV